MVRAPAFSVNPVTQTATPSRPRVPDRAAYSSGGLIQKLGGKLTAGYGLLGEKDIVLIVDFPGVDELTKASLGLARLTGIAFQHGPGHTHGEVRQAGVGEIGRRRALGERGASARCKHEARRGHTLSGFAA